MEVFKKFVLFAVATIAVVFLIIWSLDAFGSRSPISAFLVNWLALCWVATASLVVHFSFPLRYYDIKAFERTGQVYERLGIRLVKRLLRRGPLSIFSRTLRFPKEKTISALRHLDHEMRKAETIHGFHFMLMLLFVSYALLRGWFDAVGWMLAFNVIINGYPIMLQRYNRIKLQELVHKQDSRLIEPKETQEIHSGAA
jgi:hypothetical protein